MLIDVVNPLEYFLSLDLASRSLYPSWVFLLPAHQRLSHLRVGKRAGLGDERGRHLFVGDGLELGAFPVQLVLRLELQLCAVHQLYFQRTGNSVVLLFGLLLDVVFQSRIKEDVGALPVEWVGLGVDCVGLFLQKPQDLEFCVLGPDVIMVAIDQLELLESLGLIEEGFGVVDVDEGVLEAADEEDGTLYFFDHGDGFEFAEVEVGGLLLPEDVLDVLLDGVDDAVEEEGGEEGEVVVAEFVDEQF